MATLQSFQAEIDDIRNRELARTRAQSQPETLRRGHIDHKSATKLRKKTVGGEVPTTSPVTPKSPTDESTQELTDIEYSIEARYACTPYPSFSLMLPLYRAHYCLQRAEIVRQEI
jgi:hypothetical protein